MHRLILNLEDDDIREPDHINRDSLDNRRSNLRIVTRSINHFNRNMLRTNTSGVTGVSYNKRDLRWEAYIHRNNKKVNLGWFLKKKDAIEARLKAEDAFVL